MITKKDAMINPYLRKFLVCRVFRRLIKEGNQAFDPEVKSFANGLVDEIKKSRNEFDYKKYSKVFKDAETHCELLMKSNSRGFEAASLKASKDLLKIAYKVKNKFNTRRNILSLKTSQEKAVVNKRISTKVKENITEIVKGLKENTHEHIAYRMAFGIPTRFTKQESESLITSNLLINL